MKKHYPPLFVAVRRIALLGAILLFSLTKPSAQAPNCGYATSQQSPINSGVCVLCSVQNAGNSVDGDTTNYTTVTAAVNGVGYYGQLLKFNNTYLAGDSISLVLEVPSQLINATLLGGIRLQTYVGNAPTGPVITANDPLIRVQLLGGTSSKFRISFAAVNNFDGVGVSINGAVALLSSLRIYTAQAFVPPPRIVLPLGIQATSQHSPIFSGVCALCGVLNPQGAVDRDTTTYSTITPAVGAVGYVSQLLHFPGSFRAGDSISLLLRLPAGIADVQVLGGIRVETYQGNTPSGNPRFLNTIARLELLGNNRNFRVVFAPGESFDGIAVGINGAASVLSSLRVYDAAVTSSAQSIITACTGASSQFTVGTPLNATINWYTAASGGAAIASGATFTTPPLSSPTTYYAEASRNGCTNTVRTAVTVQPVAIPAAPVVTPSSFNICPGDSVLATAANNGTSMITWYTAPTGGSALASGDTLYIPGPAVTTTYYAQASNGNCASATRTPLTVTVGTAPINVSVAPPSATISSGQTASFTATSNDATAVYNWFTQPAGGSAVSTGKNFTSPPLSASTTYYLQAQSAGGCINPARIVVPVTVNNTGNNIPCDAASSQNIVTNGICIGCSVVNASSATDSDTTTFSQLHVVAGLLGGYTEQQLIFPFAGDAGDSVVIGIHFPASVADVNLLSSLQLASYNGATYNNDRVATNNALVSVSLLPGNQDAILKFVPQANFDRIQVRLNSGVAGLVSETDIRYAKRVKPSASITPSSPTACAGNPVTLVAAGNANSSFKWYDAATGGTLLYTGTNFTTPTLSNNTTYYVAPVSSTGCEQSARKAVTVTVSPVPATPAAIATQLSTCNGSTVNAGIQSPDPALTYNWYAVSTGGTPVATGANFASGVLVRDTVFYVESVNSNGCASNTRTAVSISVSTLPPAPTATVASGAVCAGSSALLAVTNPVAGYTYQWFGAPSGGTVLATGASFTSPALNANTTYYVSATTVQGCTGSRTPVNVTVNPAPAAPVVNVVPAGSVSAGQTATLTISGPAAGVTYNYYLQNTGGVAVGSGTSYTTPALAVATSYYVEAVSAAGCTTLTRTTVNIPVNAVVTLNCDAASTQSNAANGLCVGCTVTNPGNAVDNSNTTASTFNMTVAALGANITQLLQFPALSETGDSVSILIGLPGTLSPSDLGAALQLETFNGATSNGDLRNGSAASVRVYPQSGNQYILRFAPAALFDGVQVIMNSGLVSLFTSLHVYYASRQVSAPVLTTNAVNICSGGNATLSVAPRGNAVVNWFTTPTGGTAVATGNVFTATGISTSTVYYAEATRISNNCVNATRVPVNITVTPAPAAPTLVNNSITVCAGNPAAIFVANASPSLTYRFYADATGGVPLGSGSSFTTPAINTSARYYVEAVNGTGCVSGSRTPVDITVAATPATPVITGNTGNCEGSIATLTVTNPASGATYNFYNTASGGSVLYSGTSFNTPVLSTSRSFFVESVGAQACVAGSARTEILVTVNPAPADPAVGSSSVTVCGGSPANLSVSAPQANTNYQWYDAPTGGNLVYNGASITTAPVSTNTTLYLQAVSTAGCRSLSRTAVNIQVAATPSSPVVTNFSGAICEGGKAQLGIQNTGGGILYDWYDAASGGNLVYQGELFTTAALNATTTFYVSARNSNGCSSARTAVTVTVNPAPDAPVVTPVNPTVSVGGSITLAISDPQSGYTYRFYDANGALLATGTSYNTGSLSATATFYVEAASGPGCTSATRTPVTVTVSATPPVPVVTGNNAAICANSAANLVVSNAASDVTYNWYDAASGGNLLFSAPAITTPLLTQTTKYYVEAVRNGMSSARTEVTVAVNPRPAAPVISPVVVESCSATPITLAVQNAAAGITYNFYNAPVGGTPLQTGASYIIQNPQTGAYYADAVNSFGCTSTTRTAIGITVMPVLAAPVASVASKTATQIVFRWNSVAGATGYHVSVDGGNTWVTPSSGPNGLTHTIAELKPGQAVSFVVRALGTIACQASASSNSLSVDTDNPLGDELFIPNSFTPNGDGRNDRFRAYGNTVNTMDIYIYSQWGNLLYKQSKDTNGWDGTSGGQLQPVGVYIYIMHITLRNGSIVTRKGSVNLIR